MAASLFTTQSLFGALVLDFASHTNSFTDGVNRVIGWDFTTGATPLYLTSLSFFDEGQDGLLVPHTVGLYHTTFTVLLAAATIPSGTAAPLDGFFRTVAITPLLLPPNTTFTVAGTWPGNSDPWVWDDNVLGVAMNGIVTDPNITTGTAPARFNDTTATLTFPANPITNLNPTDPRNWFVGPNVGVSTVPEPTSALLLLSGAAAFLRRRPRLAKPNSH